MKILFFISSLRGGGAERVVSVLSNYWSNKGWQISIITLAPTKEDMYKLNSAIDRRSLGLLEDSGNIVRGLWRNGRRIIRLRRELIYAEADVAVAMMGQSSVVMAFSALGLTRVVPIGANRNNPKLEDRPIWRGLQSLAYGHLASVVAQTQGAASWLRANTNVKRIHIIPNPVEWPLPATEPRISPVGIYRQSRELLISVGRLDYQKGFDLLIDAFAQCAARHPEWDLVIIGEGPWRPDLQSRITVNRLGTRVFLPGWAGNISDWYRLAGIFVLSSRYEGFPNALLEAMAHGCPAISFDCEHGPRDLIQHNKNGVLVPAENVNELAKALNFVIGDPSFRKVLGSNARVCREKFSVGNVAGIWENMFCELVEERRNQIDKIRSLE